MIFSIDQDVFYIQRNIKQGKRKDSVSSTLYTIAKTPEQITAWMKNNDQEVLHPGIDIIQKYAPDFPLQEIPTKTDTELAALLNDRLPPKEVVMNTQIILQESDNIFTMTASERITVFKHMFGLLSIDDGKERIRQARKELQTKIKVTQDTTIHDRKLQ